MDGWGTGWMSEKVDGLFCHSCVCEFRIERQTGTLGDGGRKREITYSSSSLIARVVKHLGLESAPALVDWMLAQNQKIGEEIMCEPVCVTRIYIDTVTALFQSIIPTRGAVLCDVWFLAGSKTPQLPLLLLSLFFSLLFLLLKTYCEILSVLVGAQAEEQNQCLEKGAGNGILVGRQFNQRFDNSNNNPCSGRLYIFTLPQYPCACK